MTREALALRRSFGVPDDVRYVVVLDQTSHLDWDWLKTFEEYYLYDHNLDFLDHAVRSILRNAKNFLTADPAYHFSIAEIAYLRRFAHDPAEDFQGLSAAAPRFRLIGGGMTSPDELLPHGETLLRNFLVARVWVASMPETSPLRSDPFRQMWVPDSFGHDPQLPMIVEALGMQGAGFARVPGDPLEYWTFEPDFHSGPDDIAAAVLLKEGVDFVWESADGSSCIAHWMQEAYFQGQDIKPGSTATLTQYFKRNQAASKTDYVYIPVANDFSLPVEDLPLAAKQWNEGDGKALSAFAVTLTFDEFVQLLAFHKDELKRRRLPDDCATAQGQDVAPFRPTPYWMGCLPLRPEIRILHHAATNALLAAETFGAILARLAGSDAAHFDAISAGWDALVPSTHHDYLPGTAAGSVYLDEQLRFLHTAQAIGEGALASATRRLAASIEVNAPAGELAVAVCNAAGFARGGLAVMTPQPSFAPASFHTSAGATTPVQVAADGSWIFLLGEDVPSLGYDTGFLGTAPASLDAPASAHRDADGVTLTNGIFTAVIGNDGRIVSAAAAGTSRNLLGGPANGLQFYDDAANDPYQLSNEKGGSLAPIAAAFTTGKVEIPENGPVRATVVVSGWYGVNGRKVAAVHEYSVVSGEPLLRIRTTASSPVKQLVMVEFPLPDPVGCVTYGTPYHWQRVRAVPAVVNDRMAPPFFDATHSFVIPAASADGPPLAVLYHQHLPAWTASYPGSPKSLMACLMRNPESRGSKGVPSVESDPDPHTLSYALRLPDGSGLPGDGTPLRESLAWRMPLHAAPVLPVSGVPRSLPRQYSLATASPAAAIVTAAKEGSLPGETAGDLVLRVYQPTNGALDVTLTLGAPKTPDASARAVTAMETPVDAERAALIDVQLSGDTVRFHAVRAITTLAVRRQTVA